MLQYLPLEILTHISTFLKGRDLTIYGSICKSTALTLRSITLNIPGNVQSNIVDEYFRALISGSVHDVNSMNIACRNNVHIDVLGVSGIKLQHLDITYTDGPKYVTTIDPMAKLSSLITLKSLKMRSPPLRNIDFLGCLTSLTSLDLGYYKQSENMVVNISERKNINGLVDVTGPVNYTSERSFDIIDPNEYQGSTNISPLQSLVNIKELTLLGHNITDGSPLKCLTDLTSLRIYSIKNLSSLQSIISLTSLDLSSNDGLRDISPLKYLTSLTSLDLSSCDSVKDISPLQHLTKLNSLDLSCCDRLYNIDPLGLITSLTKLNLSDNCCMSNLSGIKDLTNLTELDLSYNDCITSISSLKSIVKLQILHLNNCDELIVMVGLRSLVNLLYLDISRCRRLRYKCPSQCLTMRMNPSHIDNELKRGHVSLLGSVLNHTTIVT